jgi:uncharacterized membrane protein
MAWRGSTTVPERIFASLPYLLPLISSLAFAASFFKEFPAVAQVLIPLLAPVLLVYGIVPFPSLIIFFALFFFVVRNERVAHFIRYNTMQALLVDILLTLAGLILPFFSSKGGLNLIYSTLSTTVFLGVVAIVGFSVVQSFRGRYAEIPTLSDAVYMQVR